MKTSPRLVAALAAATLLLSACGSDDTAGTSTPAAASSTAAAPATTSADEPSKEITENTTTEDTTSDDTTTDDTTSEDTSSEDSTTESSAGRIIGGDVDSLDETSAAWFSAMCEGLVPMVTVGDVLQQNGADAAAASASVQALATGLIATSLNLGELPPPTFDGGDEIATVVIDGFAKLGTTFQEASNQLAANDPAALTTITTALESNPLAALQDAKMNPELQDDFRALPACAPLNN